MNDLTQQKVNENLNWLPVGSRVRVRETGAEGKVATVLPDKWGAPWSIQVKLTDDTLLILGPHEIQKLDTN